MRQFRQYIHKRFAALVPYPALRACQTAGKEQRQTFSGRFPQQHFIQFCFDAFQGKVAAPADIKDIPLLQVILCTGLPERQAVTRLIVLQQAFPGRTV